jgi:hypothetical protein
MILVILRHRSGGGGGKAMRHTIADTLGARGSCD